MTFRTRLLISVSGGIVISLISLGHLIRREMEHRMADQFVDRVAAITDMIGDQLDREQDRLAGQLESLGRAIEADNGFRRALIQGGADGDRASIIDYASGVIETTALDLFRIQSDSGRILSSGHFRNEFGGMQPGIGAPGNTPSHNAILLEVGSPAGPFVALARMTQVRIGTVDLVLVGGVRIDGLLDRLGTDPNVWIEIVYRDSGRAAAVLTSPMQRELPLTYLPSGAVTGVTASIVVTHSDEPLTALRKLIDDQILIAIGITLIFTLIGVLWVVRYVSRPLDELAEKTALLDLDRLDVDFSSTRKDEIGGLSRLLGSLVERLRASAVRVRDAERRAATGDLARQVNHDIKNGLMPLRNVFRHMDEVSRDQPDQLPHVFVERRSTIESSIEYLGDLAANYAGLAPAFDHSPSDLNAVVRSVAEELGGRGEIRLELSQSLGSVSSDPVVSRRIVENLVGNAVDAAGASGTVTVTTATQSSEGGSVARLTVADTGAGMTEEQLERAFEDFYTTKDGGTGLGLSVVRRLVLDLNGSLKVETEPGSGTRFTVDIPLSGRS